MLDDIIDVLLDIVFWRRSGARGWSLLALILIVAAIAFFIFR